MRVLTKRDKRIALIELFLILCGSCFIIVASVLESDSFQTVGLWVLAWIIVTSALIFFKNELQGVLRIKMPRRMLRLIAGFVNTLLEDKADIGETEDD